MFCSVDWDIGFTHADKWLSTDSAVAAVTAAVAGAASVFHDATSQLGSL